MVFAMWSMCSESSTPLSGGPARPRSSRQGLHPLVHATARVDAEHPVLRGFLADDICDSRPIGVADPPATGDANAATGEAVDPGQRRFGGAETAVQIVSQMHSGRLNAARPQAE